MINRLALIILLSAFILSSCDNVYQSGLQGVVQDAAGNGIAGVEVYAYTNKSTRDDRLKKYQSGTIFSDPSCLFRAMSVQNGTFSINKIVWKTSNSQWGKDYASSSVYLLFFSEDYGLVSGGEGVNIVSGSSNQSAIVQTLTGKITTSSTCNIRFLNKDGAPIQETISFTYSYKDGYGRTITGTQSTSTGSYTVPVTYFQSVGRANITISNVTSPTGSWTLTGNSQSGDVTGASFNLNVQLERKNYYLGDGLSGQVAVSSENIPYLQGVTITLKNENGVTPLGTATLVVQNGNGLNSSTVIGSFSGLGAGQTVESGTLTFTVNQNGSLSRNLTISDIELTTSFKWQDPIAISVKSA